MKHLISEMVLCVHTRSTHQRQKWTVYIAWCRCHRVCAPVQCGVGGNCGSLSTFQQLWECLPQWRVTKEAVMVSNSDWRKKKTNVCLSPVSSRVESYEGRDRVLRPPHWHRLLRWLQWWMWAAVSPAAGSSGGWPHPLQYPDVLRVREHTHHFLFLFHHCNCVIYLFKQYDLASHVPSGQTCRWNKWCNRSEIRGCWLEFVHTVSSLQNGTAKQTHKQFKVILV